MKNVEEWRDIAGYEGEYQVSIMGRIKSLKYGKEKVISQSKAGKDYLHVVLSKNGKRNSILTHRLVAFAFPEICGEWFPGAVVNHKDENKTNNVATNLEWCTVLYNTNFGEHNEHVTKTQSKPILQYNLDGTFVSRWWGSTEVFKELGWDKRSIRKCIQGKQKTAYGYIWRYE